MALQAVGRRGQAHAPRRRPPCRAGPSAPHPHRLHPDQDGRRLRARLRGLPRAAQPHPRPRQGRHPLSSGRDPGRSQGAGDVDDLEVRRRRHPVRRSEGRRDLRSEEDVPGRTRTHDPPLHQRNPADHRPRARHPGAGRQHQRADHGVADGHVQHEPRLQRAGRHHRQAALDRRIARPQRGHRARMPVRHPGRLEAVRHPAEQPDRRRAGLRQRRRHRRPAAQRSRLHDPGRQRLARRHHQSERASTRSPSSSTRKRPAASSDSPAARRSAPRNC